MAYPASVDELTDGVPADGIAATTPLGSGTYPHDDHHRALAVAVEAIETQLVGAFTSYTPVVTGSTTNPTMGTGATASGYYHQIGRLVVGQFSIAFGSAGVAAGSGYYGFSLPVQPANKSAPIGNGYMTDSDDFTRLLVGSAAVSTALFAASTSKAVIFVTNAAGTGFSTGANPVGAAAPWTWAEGDQIAMNFIYEAASP